MKTLWVCENETVSYLRSFFWWHGNNVSMSPEEGSQIRNVCFILTYLKGFSACLISFLFIRNLCGNIWTSFIIAWALVCNPLAVCSTFCQIDACKITSTKKTLLTTKECLLSSARKLCPSHFHLFILYCVDQVGFIQARLTQCHYCSIHLKYKYILDANIYSTYPGSRHIWCMVQSRACVLILLLETPHILLAIFHPVHPSTLYDYCTLERWEVSINSCGQQISHSSSKIVPAYSLISAWRLP